MAGGSLYELMKRCIDNEAAASRTLNHEKYDKEDRLLLSTDKVRIYMEQILSGLSYIHEHGYIHRDIKPENILLHGDGIGCKVADFGLARSSRTFRGEKNHDNDNRQLTYYVSTRWYRAPEVILRCSSYGAPIDLFATGLILAELHSLRPLLPGTSEIDQLNKMMTLLGPPSEALWEEGVTRMNQLNFSLVSTTSATTNDRVEAAIRLSLPECTSPAAITLIRQLIAWNPSSRLDANDALKHNYFWPSSDSRHAKHNGGQLEKLKEKKLFKCTDSRTIEKPFAVEPCRHLHRHNIGEIILEQKGVDDNALRPGYFQSCAVGNTANMAVSSECEGVQLEQDDDQNSNPFDMEPRRHTFLHNVGEINVKEHEHFQTTSLPRYASSVRAESNERESMEWIESRTERGQDENAIPAKEALLCHRFLHNVDEFVVEQRKFSNAATRINKWYSSTASIPARQENEFCNYLDAILNATQYDQSAPVRRYHPLGNSSHPLLPEQFLTTTVDGTARIPFSSAPQRSHPIISTSNGSPNVHHNRGGRSRCSSLHSQQRRAALAEKPRWLLSNQNMGRGAMEVSVSRTAEPSIAENERVVDWSVVRTKNRSTVRTDDAGGNPFHCLF